MKSAKPKLDAPMHVSCEAIDETVRVTWELVEGAVTYQVEAVGIALEGEAVQDSQFVGGPPALLDASEYASLAVHVRGLGAPKHDKQAPQAGRKGAWSDVCVVPVGVGS